MLKQSERLFFGGAALGNLADMPQHQSARKDSQGCQHRPKGQVNAHESQLTASQPRKEHGFIGSGVEMAHKLRNPGTFSHSVLTLHDAQDLVVRGNQIKPVAPMGKTWRFLVIVGRA